MSHPVDLCLTVLPLTKSGLREKIIQNKYNSFLLPTGFEENYLHPASYILFYKGSLKTV